MNLYLVLICRTKSTPIFTPPNQLEKGRFEKRLSKTTLKKSTMAYHKKTILLIIIFSKLLVVRPGRNPSI